LVKTKLFGLLLDFFSVKIYLYNSIKKFTRLTEIDLTRIVKKVILEKDKQDDNEESFYKKLMIKLKGISKDKLEYNMKNNLPWDWKGSKEGYYEKMENKRNYSGSN